ncbi:MAG: PHP domain-containing protein [Ruminococcaceae bacterium]|nr:PHP domain-containing protein [Oscillospiraceae bacterium]
MKYRIDHDIHIHTHLSLCSGDPGQTKEALVAYAKENGYKTLCITDHFWDSAIPGPSGFYAPQNYEHLAENLPLPTDDSLRILFGCETELSRDLRLAIPPERYDCFDFIVIPTTHMHMKGFTVRGDESDEERAEIWCRRLEAVLRMDLPFHKVGIAHITSTGIQSENKGYLRILPMIPDAELHRLFGMAAKVGVGIELNHNWLASDEREMEIHLRYYRIAKEEGCKFYLGSDAHHPDVLLRAKKNFSKIVDALELTESDKFVL